MVGSELPFTILFTDTFVGQPPKQGKSDSRSCTLLFKKHKTTVLLSLQPHESLTSAKEKLLGALASRGLQDINGDAIPTDPAEVELGVPVDKSDLEKGWMRLSSDIPGQDEDAAAKKTTAKSKAAETLQAVGLQNGSPVAFRFRKPTEAAVGDEFDADLELTDPGWDVVIPSFDDEEV
jgi:hypothetical protein